MSLSEVKCPKCGKKFMVTYDDYKNNPQEKYCYCVNCTHEFPVLDGKPWPSLDSDRRF